MNLCLRSDKFICYQFIMEITIKLQLRLPYPSHIPCLNNNPHNVTKYENGRTSKIPILELFIESGDIWKCSLS